MMPRNRHILDSLAEAKQRGLSAVNCLKNRLTEMLGCLRKGTRPIEREIEEQARHMSSLMDSVATGIISLDGEGRIRVFNAAAESLFHMSRGKVLGRPFSEAGRVLDAGEDHTLRALWERLSDAIWAAGAAVDLEYDLVTRNGRRTVVSYSVYPLGRTAWSVDKGVVIVFEDITRKKEMEDQISDARKRLQAVFDGITDGIQVVDSHFRVTAVNKSMTSLVKKTIKIGEHCYQSCSSGSGICVDCPAVETFRTGMPASVTRKLPVQKIDSGVTGGEQVVEISTFPLVDRANRVVQVVEYIKDVTEKVELSGRLEHARRLAELGEMAARVAHEVRNPLNAITGAAHYLSTEYAGDETLQKFTSLIKRQSIRVNQVASNLLTVSKPMRPNLSNVNVNAVLGQALASLRDLIREQGIAVEHDLTEGLPAIRADELQIEHAFSNIIRNAVEAMPEGGTLRLATALSGDGSWIEVGIQDSGQGIADEDRERIFQSFFTTKTKGTGLGLTIVQRVLKNHRGSIVMERPETGGTRVLLCLPTHAGDPQTASSPCYEQDSAPDTRKAGSPGKRETTRIP